MRECGAVARRRVPVSDSRGMHLDLHACNELSGISGGRDRFFTHKLDAMVAYREDSDTQIKDSGMIPTVSGL